MSRIDGNRQPVAGTQVVLDEREVDRLAWEPASGQPGIYVKNLWKDSRDDSVAGLMRLEARARMTAHSHRYSVHHIWVSDGECIAAARSLRRGSYCFVPAGVAHGIEAGAEGCEIFYLYLRAQMD